MTNWFRITPRNDTHDTEVSMKVLKAGLLGGYILFVWGWFSWIYLPWHPWYAGAVQSFTHEESVEAVLTANAPKAGIYVLPRPHEHPGLFRREWDGEVAHKAIHER